MYSLKDLEDLFSIIPKNSIETPSWMRVKFRKIMRKSMWATPVIKVSKYKRHQGRKECERRIRQLRKKEIFA